MTKEDFIEEYADYGCLIAWKQKSASDSDALFFCIPHKMKTRVCSGVNIAMRRMSDMAVGEVGTVVSMTYKGALRRRLQDIGLAEGTEVRCIQKSPLGDPTAFLIRGAVMAIRKEDSRGIFIE